MVREYGVRSQDRNRTFRAPARARGMKADVVKAVVRYKSGVESRNKTPKGVSPDEAFDIRFVLVTRDDVQAGM